MITSEQIRTEQCPYLREIYSLGYDTVISNQCKNSIRLERSSDRYFKEIPLFKLTDHYTIREGLSPDGELHRWISDADGSADRFREVIKPLQ